MSSKVSGRTALDAPASEPTSSVPASPSPNDSHAPLFAPSQHPAWFALTHPCMRPFLRLLRRVHSNSPTTFDKAREVLPFGLLAMAYMSEQTNRFTEDLDDTGILPFLGLVSSLFDIARDPTLKVIGADWKYFPTFEHNPNLTLPSDFSLPTFAETITPQRLNATPTMCEQRYTNEFDHETTEKLPEVPDDDYDRFVHRRWLQDDGSLSDNTAIAAQVPAEEPEEPQGDSDDDNPGRLPAVLAAPAVVPEEKKRRAPSSSKSRAPPKSKEFIEDSDIEEVQAVAETLTKNVEEKSVEAATRPKARHANKSTAGKPSVGPKSAVATRVAQRPAAVVKPDKSEKPSASKRLKIAESQAVDSKTNDSEDEEEEEPRRKTTKGKGRQASKEPDIDKAEVSTAVTKSTMAILGKMGEKGFDNFYEVVPIDLPKHRLVVSLSVLGTQPVKYRPVHGRVRSARNLKTDDPPVWFSHPDTIPISEVLAETAEDVVLPRAPCFACVLARKQQGLDGPLPILDVSKHRCIAINRLLPNGLYNSSRMARPIYPASPIAPAVAQIGNTFRSPDTLRCHPLCPYRSFYPSHMDVPRLRALCHASLDLAPYPPGQPAVLWITSTWPASGRWLSCALIRRTVSPSSITLVEMVEKSWDQTAATSRMSSTDSTGISILSLVCYVLRFLVALVLV
ncbi:hypothetical protein C8F01DRAFT_1089736 [Mycena amicta]|nr:hypothetical protein C8F01DRAFT_1089736 [Mycena amicta]